MRKNCHVATYSVKSYMIHKSHGIMLHELGHRTHSNDIPIDKQSLQPPVQSPIAPVRVSGVYRLLTNMDCRAEHG
jgi:hypothetical protein